MTRSVQWNLRITPEEDREIDLWIDSLNLTLTIEDRNRASHWLGTSARQLAPHNLPLPVPGLVWLSRLALEITGRHHGLTWTGSPRLVLHKL